MDRVLIVGAAGVCASVLLGAMLGASQPDSPRVPRPRPGTQVTPTVPAGTQPVAPSTGGQTPPPPPSVIATPLTAPAEAIRFEIEIEGVMTSREVRASIATPLYESLDVVEFQEATDPRLRLRPGARHGGSFQLVGPLPMPGVMASWYHATRQGELQRRSGSLIIMNAASQEIQRFNFYEGWPRAMSIDPTTGTWTIEVAYEFVELG